MTLERARALLVRQAAFGGGYQRNGARLVLAEVSREHGQAAVDALIRELGLESIFGFAPGTRFETPGPAARREGWHVNRDARAPTPLPGEGEERPERAAAFHVSRFSLHVSHFSR